MVTVPVTFTPLRHLAVPSSTFLWLRNCDGINSHLTGLKSGCSTGFQGNIQWLEVEQLLNETNTIGMESRAIFPLG